MILAAAARMFQKRGYTGTTMRDLAREVGITSGSIFHHFRCKEDMLLAVVERGLAEGTQRITEAQMSGGGRPRIGCGR
jgi:AcrR family transcriptional regulator